MALFLSESVESTKVVSLHEAMSDMLDVVNEGAQLGDAILRADFILHNQAVTGNLNEAEIIDKAKGFLSSAYQKVKAFVLKVIAKVKQFIYALLQRIKGWFGKAEIVDSQNYKVSKERLARINTMAGALAVSAGMLKGATAEDVKSKADAFKKSFHEGMSDKGSDGGQVAVKGSVIRSAMKEVEAAIDHVKGVETELNAAVTAAQKAVADVANGKKEAKEAAGKALELARGRASAVTSAIIPAANTLYGMLVGLRPTFAKVEGK